MTFIILTHERISDRTCIWGHISLRIVFLPMSCNVIALTVHCWQSLFCKKRQKIGNRSKQFHFLYTKCQFSCYLMAWVISRKYTIISEAVYCICHKGSQNPKLSETFFFQFSGLLAYIREDASISHSDFAAKFLCAVVLFSNLLPFKSCSPLPGGWGYQELFGIKKPPITYLLQNLNMRQERD